MVTRVDKKPIIYNSTLIRCWKPSVVAERKLVLSVLHSKSRGYAVPKVSPRDILDDYEDVELGFRMLGSDDPAFDYLDSLDDDDGDESLRIARMCLNREANIRKAMRSASMMEEISKIQGSIAANVDRIYYGTEAIYKLYAAILHNNVFRGSKAPNYAEWALKTANRVLITQSPHMFLHPDSPRVIGESYKYDLGMASWQSWDIFKKTETMMLRLSSRRNLLAHSYYYGVNRKGFEPAERPEDDFEIPLSGYTESRDSVRMHIIMGLKYYTVGEEMYVLSPDDCVNLATMAQCYYRTAVYFMRGNGYSQSHSDRALAIVKDIVNHCCRLIDLGKNYSHIIRSLHILAQGDFNDAFEESMGSDLGWKERSENYMAEAMQLDVMGPIFHRRIMGLATDEIDKLNVGFLYHNFVGDEMLLEDLRFKVNNMSAKVQSVDKDEWALFLRFCKAYLLCRFMMTNKRKPKAGGDIILLNSQWAERCVKGLFTMPPQCDWGRVWIQGEFTYSTFADIWHLEAQDVSYVVKDSKGLAAGKYRENKFINSELLMAMVYGNKLDINTDSTPRSARERMCKGIATPEVVLTTAPKAENAKPSWKKRVTFAADCEFRKLQAEYDRNCRKVMSFVRGPSLGVDQCVLEKQFHDISVATSLGTSGSICSHDISAWSESMDRDRKFEFEKILIDTLDTPDAINISLDWGKIKGTILKQGSKDVVDITNGSFQGFDGSASSILHSLILIYCIDSARRAGIMSTGIKTNMATLIDDCIALMKGLCRIDEANKFWAHLKATYKKLGFVVDDLKSIFSTIKAIYLSRRFLMGGEVPSDLKVYLKAHSSYEDPLRSPVDIAADIMGAMRGAADANGNIWYIYYTAVVSILADIAHSCNCIMSIPPDAAAIFALAPIVENGWGIPTMIDWATNDVTDKRAHFNSMMERFANQEAETGEKRGTTPMYTKLVGIAMRAIKSQAWRLVSVSNIFTNPFDALREGPLKPDMLKRNAVQDILSEVAVAEPWQSLLKWNSSATTIRVRELLISSGPLHAPTLAAMVNCMPDNYRLSLMGKAIGSQSLLNCLGRGQRARLRRRVIRCAQNYFSYTSSLFSSCKQEYKFDDFAAINYIERTKMERDEFFSCNGVIMTDHTFPDPIGTFNHAQDYTGSLISPNSQSLMLWDRNNEWSTKVSQLISVKGTFFPRRSNRVWEVTSEYGKGWDSVSQRIAMGLAILARAEADGHGIKGLLAYFVRSWNEFSNITPNDTHLIAIHGSIKRLDANPGSSTHPIIASRNILSGFHNKLKSALDAIPIKAKEMSGSTSHLHDYLSHETSMLAVTAILFAAYHHIGVDDKVHSHPINTRPDCVVPEDVDRMNTDRVADMIEYEILESAEPYGLLQACPDLAVEIAIPTMQSSWVRMINALVDGKYDEVEALRHEAKSKDIARVIQELADGEASYVTAVVLAETPAERGHINPEDRQLFAVAPTKLDQRNTGDTYTSSVRTMGSKFAKALNQEQPAHIGAAIAIRSSVWSKLKSRGALALSKILYHDEGMDLAIIRNCAKADFWSSVVYEISSAKKALTLSEAAMQAFRSLGTPGIHIRASDSVEEVTQSVASYFGAHLAEVTHLIGDQITSIGGRSASAYSKPILEKIVTNNPALHNAKMRRDHMASIITYNKANLSERLSLLGTIDCVHRGDRRVSDINVHARRVELRTRLYVYNHAKLKEDGSVVFPEDEHGKFIAKCAKIVGERVEYDITQYPPDPLTLQHTLEYMDMIESLLKGKDSGWDAESGKLGTRTGYNFLMSDSMNVLKTQFAVSASEIAPRLHKRVCYTPASTSSPAPTAPDPSPFMSPDQEEPLGIDLDSMFAALRVMPTKLQMEAWKGVYTLLYVGVYSAQEVNDALGTDIPEEYSNSDLREAHLSDFSDALIYEKFPRIFGEYLNSGTPFDDEWLNRDEAEAYTTDEIGRGYGGNIM